MQSDQWERKIPQWDLAADDADVVRKESVVLVNGKPNGFADVHDGPAIYIGRSNAHYNLTESILSNPYNVQEHGRLDACLKYTDHLVEQVQENQMFRKHVFQCHGRPLACWCSPELCHGDVIGLFLVYRLHLGWDLERTRSEIKQRLNRHVDFLIRKGKVDPSSYQARS